MKIVVNNIVVPLIVIFNFYVTTDKIELNKYFLNFDKTFTDEANKLSLSMQNKSLLPQNYGFIMLPKELSVQKNIDSILSDEKIKADIIYESQDNYLGHREGDIVRKHFFSLFFMNYKMFHLI